MFVGTYRDKVDDTQFQEKDQLLQNSIKDTEFFKRGIIKFAADGQLMLSVDNLSGTQEEIDKIRNRLVEVIEENFEKITIPASWLVLSLHIRSKELRTMTLEECEGLAKKVGIGAEEVQEVLWFLHRHMGVLLYFPELDDLKNTVICDIQVVFDSATNLIRNTFTFKNVDEAVRETFRKTGQFTLKDVHKAMSDHVDALLPPNKLIKLLEYLNVLTVIPNTESADRKDTENPTFFMPCVLRSARDSELDIPELNDSDPAPLLLYYKCGYVPAGLFPALIANLISQQREDWEMILDGLFKNRVEFYVGKDYDIITLISHPRFFKIVISRSKEFLTPTEVLCTDVLEVIQSTLRTITSRMNNFSMECSLGFECPDHPREKHLCELAKMTSKKMLCLRNPNRKHPIRLKPFHEMWFSHKNSIAYQCRGKSYLYGPKSRDTTHDQ